MSTSYRYALPVEQTEWKFDGHTDVTFTWEYDDNRAGLLQLYSKGKQQEVWERLGLPVDECIEILDHSETMQLFRSRLFTRIVPTVKDIGLWGPKVQEAFAAMGAIEFAKIDAAALLDNDARVAEDFDAKMRLKDASAA